MRKSITHRIQRTVDIVDSGGESVRILRVTLLVSKDSEYGESRAAVGLAITSTRPDVHFVYNDGFADFFSLDEMTQLRDTLSSIISEKP